MSNPPRLDFEGLPSFAGTPFFFSLPDDTERRLRHLPSVYDRCNAALRFNSWVGADAEFLHIRDEELGAMRVALLRAALMEYAGMEEAIRIDVGRSGSLLRIRDTRNAMLVVLRELRNVQVHLVKTEFLRSERPAVARMNGQEHQLTLTALTIPAADLEKLKDSRNSAHWNREDFERAVNWLSEAQEHWGICDVVREGVWAYATVVADQYVPVESEDPAGRT